MATGRIKSWVNGKGYGFIKPDGDGSDVFVHVRQILGGLNELFAGDRVSYEIGTNERNGREEAKCVRVIEG